MSVKREFPLNRRLAQTCASLRRVYSDPYGYKVPRAPYGKKWFDSNTTTTTCSMM